MSDSALFWTELSALEEFLTHDTFWNNPNPFNELQLPTSPELQQTSAFEADALEPKHKRRRVDDVCVGEGIASGSSGHGGGMVEGLQSNDHNGSVSAPTETASGTDSAQLYAANSQYGDYTDSLTEGTHVACQDVKEALEKQFCKPTLFKCPNCGSEQSRVDSLKRHVKMTDACREPVLAAVNKVMSERLAEGDTNCQPVASVDDLSPMKHLSQYEV
ncbi:uncharacterized protein B0H18DRAFT_1207906 [Fomitopsis serialis]|uniref:uncharacterized protein n=1 Tax=Fomitopsis serialis TaxID=139415 RepID=UPI0020075C73|nr:uncharacterized protein B0H18DRAFT_1207906 [Neoantrodia serialis]KAH9933741.1 hypothetical protein B0H18DRAFT_1207906 [Neoantrodia serialis]